MAIGAATETPVRTFPLPHFIAQLSGAFAWTAEKLTTLHLGLPTMISEFGKHSYCAIEKARNELGYAPSRTLADGIRDAVRDLNASSVAGS
jgi:nucleoside-diphosphate-sugar epimerase